MWVWIWKYTEKSHWNKNSGLHPQNFLKFFFFFAIKKVVNYRLYLLIKIETNQDKLSCYNLSTSCQPTCSNYSSTYNKKRLCVTKNNLLKQPHEESKCSPLRDQKGGWQHVFLLNYSKAENDLEGKTHPSVYKSFRGRYTSYPVMDYQS